MKCAGCGVSENVVWSSTFGWQTQKFDLCWTCDRRIVVELLPALKELAPPPRWAAGLGGGCENCGRATIGRALIYRRTPKDVFHLCEHCAPALIVLLPTLQFKGDSIL